MSSMYLTNPPLTTRERRMLIALRVAEESLSNACQGTHDDGTLGTLRALIAEAEAAGTAPGCPEPTRAEVLEALKTLAAGSLMYGMPQNANSFMRAAEIIARLEGR
ncbi:MULTISPECIES: hypothetical protein [unclassified Chelatococcus]|uniref:hypothetical protein n=1 Tax=unclassified Chelatococcus TaxID=2638111 RepID=UPI0002D4720B|nr:MULTISPECIES: hypothetical protein [unclassified Chelatococcus]ALA16094.1 hypothetical protein AL346_00150 [Chelatococcus sp. CO-6]